MARNKYGGRGRPWHDDFIKYVEYIAAHPNYEGMPDAYSEPGRVQWEAPSNRTSGQFKDTNNKRRDWWQRKAVDLEIDVGTVNWISRTARKLHPTKKKPCKICGRVMELLYVYPTANLLKRVQKLFDLPDEFELSSNERIDNLLRRVYEIRADRFFLIIPSVLNAKGIVIPSDIDNNIEAWVGWIEQSYIPLEPSTLGPGAMSNAPDRFDGFHSDNRCCRALHDKGRRKTNMAKYSTDRRVFEYWAEGEWIAADRLMGLVRRDFSNEKCLNGHSGPCDADHIGPLSLGFRHRPCFQLLCSPCNSGKNNRMSMSDVQLLRGHELAGERVVSWHSRAVWDLLKDRVVDDSSALRLSKIMRDNRHSFMSLLKSLLEGRFFSFLGGLLELERADTEISFLNLRVENHLTKFDKLIQTPRTNKYAMEQKARRLRIAFAALIEYEAVNNRNAYVVQSDIVTDRFIIFLDWLNVHSNKELDNKIDLLTSDAKSQSEWENVAALIPAYSSEYVVEARNYFSEIMSAIAEILADQWNADRYVRN